MTHRFASLLCCSFVGAVLAACVVESARANPQHCWHAEGDATCVAAFGAERPFCTHDLPPCNQRVQLGCVDERPIDECYSPCGSSASIVEDDSCVPEPEPEPEAEPAMASGADVGLSLPSPPSCEVCPASLPYCWAGECVECSADEDCPGICNADHGCQGCTHHDQCPGGAGCDVVTGNCLPGDFVLHVGPNQHSLSLSDAMAELGGESGTLVVHSDVGGYHETIEVAPGQTLVVRASPNGATPLLYDAGIVDCSSVGSYGIEVGGRLYLEHMQLRGRGGIRVDGEAYIERTRIAATSCRAALCMGGELEIENSMLVGTWVNPDGDAVLLPGPMPCNLSISHSSIYAYSESAVACDSMLLTPGSSLRNSLFYAPEGLFACGSLATPSTFEVSEDWFVDPSIADLHLAVFAATLDTFQLGDPLFDIDGDPRQPDNHAGADGPAP